ncbi:FOG: CheY-like receiver,regulator of chemotaxis and motility [Magnetospirillum sp. XM-1]|uniref:response regulator n=1 Tax=Magnetospirillum sp. XM-1 TaxID=1663591 RepID=UPI00073E0C66|nr:response regulator [Magnetospirillum sp. XM-1]CUW40509.1 FOG: CheY-like receiver,regulator of chemotaxis and motility [Magnetospirillum sp. XM-1]
MHTTPLKVIIVDDSIITVKKLTVLMEGLGHQVVATVSNGLDAIEAYRRHQPDLMTMDISLPDMDGMTATARIVAEFPAARIMMVTSHGQERMVIDSLDAGAKGYVLKPVRIEKLSDMIAKIMERAP